LHYGELLHPIVIILYSHISIAAIHILFASLQLAAAGSRVTLVFRLYKCYSKIFAGIFFALLVTTLGKRSLLFYVTVELICRI
jgi:hypothetical protein